MLQKAGFSQSEISSIIQNLKAGGGISGYQVHHKIPLSLGGTNDFSNLVMMKHIPFHLSINRYTSSEIIPNLPVGQTGTFSFPKIEGNFYSPPFIE